MVAMSKLAVPAQTVSCPWAKSTVKALNARKPASGGRVP